MVGYLSSASALTTVILQMPIARLSDKFGGIISIRVIAATWTRTKSRNRGGVAVGPATASSAFRNAVHSAEDILM